MQTSVEAFAADQLARARSVTRRPNVEQQREPLSTGQIKDRCADYDAHPGEAPPDPLLGSGRGLRGESANILIQVQEKLSKLGRDPTRNTAQFVLAGAEYAREAGDKQLSLIEEQREKIAKRLDEMRAETEKLMQPSEVATKELLPELRTALRTMTEEDRDNLLHSTRGTPDFVPVLYAVSSAPAFLSGVHPAKRMEMRNLVLGIRRPELLTLPGHFEEELSLLDKCANGFRRTLAEIADLETADALKQLSEA